MQAMEFLPIKPLDGAAGYCRWKESILLRLRTLGLAYVLFEDEPTDVDGLSSAAKKWHNDDALCCGHILNTLSDHTFDVHYHSTTAAGLWDALARTYDLETPLDLQVQYTNFKFAVTEGGHGGESVLEQLTRFKFLAEATGMARIMGNSASDDVVHGLVLDRLPVKYRSRVVRRSKTRTMDELFEIIREIESLRLKQHEGLGDVINNNNL